MPLLNFKRGYQMKAKCFNCGHKFIMRIPLKIKIQEHLDSGNALCENCKTDEVAIDIPELKDDN